MLMAGASLSNALGLTRERIKRREIELRYLNEDWDAHRHERLEEDRRRNVLKGKQTICFFKICFNGIRNCGMFLLFDYMWETILTDSSDS